MANKWKYELPDDQKADLREAYRRLQIAKDLLARLRTAGQPMPDAEARIRELENRLKRFAAAFEVPLTEEE